MARWPTCHECGESLWACWQTCEFDGFLGMGANNGQTIATCGICGNNVVTEVPRS